MVIKHDTYANSNELYLICFVQFYIIIAIHGNVLTNMYIPVYTLDNRKNFQFEKREQGLKVKNMQCKQVRDQKVWKQVKDGA